MAGYQVQPTPPVVNGEDDLATAMRQVRDRFVAGFPGRCEEIQGALARAGDGQPVPDIVRQIMHRVAGLAGTVGFPDVSRNASAIETALTTGTAERSQLAEAVASMREAFQREVNAPAAAAEPGAARRRQGQRILIVDDDPDQRELTTGALARGGYDVVALPHADTVIETAQQVQPAAILLDVMMPGINGHLACRLLKAEPTIAHVPIVFVSSHAALEERMAGLALGAADYVAKPFDVNELLFRVKRAIEVAPIDGSPSPVWDDVLEYAEFSARAAKSLAEGPGTLVLLRVDPRWRDQLASALVGESRRRDLIGQFDRLHLVMLLPAVPAAAASARLEAILDELTKKGVEARAGIASAKAGTTLDAVVQEADEGLASARFHGSPVALKGEAPAAPAGGRASHLVLLADDDPEVARILDTQMRSLHFATALAFDGQAALTALTSRPVDLLILDLMLPKVTGFEILYHLQMSRGRHPRLIVLSARGREEDITRAFELGADDYITKPFRPAELAARVVRLLR